MALLFLCSTRADAEGTDAMTTIAAAAMEAPTSDQATPTPEPASPEPVAVPAEEPEPVPSVPEELEQVQTEAERATDTPVETVKKVAAAATSTTQPIVETAAKAVDRVAPTSHLDTPSHDLGSALNGATDALHETNEALKGKAVDKALDLVAAESTQTVLPPAGGLSGVGFGASPPRATPAAPSLPWADSPRAERHTSLDGLFMQRPVVFGGLETLWRPLPLSGASGSSAADLRLVPTAAVAAAGGSSVVERFANPAPSGGDRPPPPPGSPLQTQLGASGAGSSSFVPIAALLALLALAAPVIFRRLGEVADFRPPTPFVCALERPG